MIDGILFAKALVKRANEKGITVSNLKLQKLAYYSQGYSVALTGNRLFNSKIEAWQHGPVIPAMYHEFKCSGDGNIIINNQDNFLEGLNELSIKVIDFVLEKLGRIGAWELRNKSHKEAPWLSHYDTETQKVDGLEITTDELLKFFTQEASAMQDTTFAKILDSLESQIIELPEEVSNKNEFYEWIQQGA